jgi:hypothetical protein
LGQHKAAKRHDPAGETADQKYSVTVDADVA